MGALGRAGARAHCRAPRALVVSPPRAPAAAAPIAIEEASSALSADGTSLREITFALFSQADLEVFARAL